LLSGLSESMDPRHYERIKNEANEHDASCSMVEVRVRPLAPIRSEHGISEIHYLSVDTEGSEADVLASIDFDAVNVHVITAEAGYNESSEKINSVLLRDLLSSVSTSGISTSSIDAADLKHQHCAPRCPPPSNPIE